MNDANEKISAVTYLTLEENLIKINAQIREKGIDPDNNVVMFNRKDKPNDLLMPMYITPVTNTDKSQPNQNAIIITLKSLEQARKEATSGQSLQGVNPKAFIEDIHKMFSEIESDADDIQVLVGMEATPENEPYLPNISIGLDIDGKKYRMGSIENMTFVEINDSVNKKGEHNLMIFTFS